MRVFASSYFVIGDNDATIRPAYGNKQDSVSYANYLIHVCGVTSVITGQLFIRDPRKSPFGYSEEVIPIRKHLELLTSSEEHVHYWKQSGFGTNYAYLGRVRVQLGVESDGCYPALACIVKYVSK